MKELFIKTSDINTRDGLIASGFVLVDCTDGVYTFINSQTIKREKDSKEKLTYSNMLTI